MPNIFDSFSLGNMFAVDATTRSLDRVSNAIVTGNATFDTILLNDEDIRERAKTYKEGIDFDRERLSGLIGKVQQLQARLQATYQSMLDRTSVSNAAEVGTTHDLTDTATWTQDKWKSVGRGALLFAKAAHTDPTVTDTWSQGPNNLGRLEYMRPDGSNNMYEERGGFFSTLQYLWGFDLHQIRYTYATGTLGPGGAGGTPGVGNDELFEMDAIDFNKVTNIQWKLGDVITLNVGQIFTPEFMASLGAAKAGDIKYKNGSGYTYNNAPTLYAYVREVDILPDGVTKPRTIDLMTSPSPIDGNGDGIPDNVVKMNDFLTSITTDDFDLDLKGSLWNGATAPGAGAANGWVPWNGNTQPDAPAAGGVADAIWSDTSTHTYSSFHKSMAISGEIDVLQHPTLNYTGFANLSNDDDGTFYYSQMNPWWDPGTAWTTGVSPQTDWSSIGWDGGGGTNINYDATNVAPIRSMDLINNKGLEFSYTGLSGVWSGSTNGGAGQRVDNVNGGLKIEKIAGQQNDTRYIVDRFGNIFDKFGYGNGSTDYYDYIPNTKDNAKGNYVGNIFGSNTRVGRKIKLDGQAGRTIGDGVITGRETKPELMIAARDYSRPDDALSLASFFDRPETVASEVDPDTPTDATFGKAGGSAVQQNVNPALNIDTQNPAFAGLYLGFSDASQTTVGFGASQTNAFGQNLNQLQVLPWRTYNGVSATGGGAQWNGANGYTQTNSLMDRDYNLVNVGAKVQITDAAGGVVTGSTGISTGTVTAIDPVTHALTVKHDDNSVTLDPQRKYTVTTVPTSTPRLAGSLENSFVSAIKTILTGNEYQEAIRDGLLDDLMLSAASSDAFGDQISGKITLRYNRRQERVELFQNSFAAFYKSHT